MKKVTPHKLLDFLKEGFGIKTDAAFAEATGVSPPHIGHVRRGALPVGASLLVRWSEMTGLPVRELRAMLPAPEAAS
jgi:hypothetical protein